MDRKYPIYISYPENENNVKKLFTINIPYKLYSIAHHPRIQSNYF